MAGQTPRFALNFFGASTPGTLDDDNDKYTSEDRLTLDRVLAALEKHNHRVPASLDVPDEPPLLVLDPAIGNLEAGVSYHYVISFVNGDGLETITGPEVSIDTPDALEAPDAPAGDTDQASGGALTPGLYYYALSGLRGSSEESALGDTVNVTVLLDENVVTLTLPDLEEADHYQIWRMGENDPGWTRIAVSTGPTYTDTGSVPAGAYGDPANNPPTVNTGDASYSVKISLAGADVTSLLKAKSWRIYRSEISGVYGATSLVHEVVETTLDTDPDSGLRTSWIDDGDAPLNGSPKLSSTELMVPPFTFEAVTTLPDPDGYPENYPIVDAGGVLYLQRSGAWSQVSGSRGVALFTGTGNPTGSEPAGAANGDVFIDTVTGDVYVINGL